MKLFLLFVFALLSTVAATGQEPKEWERVATIEGAIIEIRSDFITLTAENSARFRYRWTYKKPQKLKNGTESRILLQEVELNCAAERYRYSSMIWLDEEGRTVDSMTTGDDEKWRSASKGTIRLLYVAGCRMLQNKRKT